MPEFLYRVNVKWSSEEYEICLTFFNFIQFSLIFKLEYDKDDQKTRYIYLNKFQITVLETFLTPNFRLVTVPLTMIPIFNSFTNSQFQYYHNKSC